MPQFIGLLRGINVGGHNKIKMDALAAIFESEGLSDVRTYIQSGNVVFNAKATGAAKLAQGIEDAIEKAAGFRPAVILRKVDEWKGVIERAPFVARKDFDPKKSAVFFLAAAPAPDAEEKLRAFDKLPEEIVPNGQELYVYYPNGMGRSKLQLPNLEKVVGCAGTARNWNTVLKLREMAEPDSAK
ncbi:DUF1697 domain-containing protein [bacterium]|nr:DUF1697 domain-containing protein [bacterium]